MVAAGVDGAGRVRCISNEAARFLPHLAVLLALLYLIAHLDLKPVLGDEGVTAVEAWRIAQGEIPQRDFFELIPPLSFYIPAVFFKVLGPSVFSLRILGLLYGILLIGAVVLVSRRYLKNPFTLSLPLALLVPFGVGVWPFPSHHWLLVILQLFGLFFLDRALSGAPFKNSLAAGLLFGAGFFALQDQGSYAVLGIALVTAAVLDPSRRRSVGLGLAAGMGLATLAMAALLLPFIGPGQLIKDWLMFPLTQYHGASGNVVGLLEGLRQIMGQWDPDALRIAPVYTTLIALGSMVVYALPFLSMGCLVVAWRRKWIAGPSLAFLAVVALAFIGGAWHRWSLMNLIWSAAVPMVTVALALERGWAAERRSLRWFSRGAAVLLLVIFGGFGILRVWAVHNAARNENLHTIRGAAGSYRTFNPYEARHLQEFLDAVETLVPPGAPAFCKGFIPLVNFLTQRPNPTRYTFLLTPGYNTDSQAREWMARLDALEVEWGLSELTAPNPLDPADVYIRENYRPVWNNQRFVLWRRISRRG